MTATFIFKGLRMTVTDSVQRGSKGRVYRAQFKRHWRKYRGPGGSHLAVLESFLDDLGRAGTVDRDVANTPEGDLLRAMTVA